MMNFIISLMQLKVPNDCFSAHLCPIQGLQMGLITDPKETKTKQALASCYIKGAGVLPKNLILWLFSVKCLEHTSFSPNGFQNSSSFFNLLSQPISITHKTQID